jgi:HAD superfamily hydrolase (TIGR01450 family)
MSDCLLRKMSAFLFDLDGCIYHSNVLADGAKELLDQLRMDGKKVGFLTNNSRETSMDITKKLQSMGLQVSCDEVMTATEYLGLYLFEEHGSCIVKIAGSEGLHHSIESAGHRVLPLEHRETADFIVVGRDTEFHFSKLQQIAVEVGRGASILATNSDGFHPGSHGERVPETGAIIAAIESVIEKKIESVGKPARHMFMHGLKRFGLTPGECVMVGDNLKTDIVGGIQSGMRTVWVRAEQSLENLKKMNSLQPDYTVKNIMDLLLLYK